MEIKNTHHSGMPRFKNNTRQMSEVPIPHPNRVEKCGTMKRAYHRVMKLKKKKSYRRKATQTSIPVNTTAHRCSSRLSKSCYTNRYYKIYEGKGKASSLK